GIDSVPIKQRGQKDEKHDIRLQPDLRQSGKQRQNKASNDKDYRVRNLEPSRDSNKDHEHDKQANAKVDRLHSCANMTPSRHRIEPALLRKGASRRLKDSEFFFASSNKAHRFFLLKRCAAGTEVSRLRRRQVP